MSSPNDDDSAKVHLIDGSGELDATVSAAGPGVVGISFRRPGPGGSRLRVTLSADDAERFARVLTRAASRARKVGGG